MNDAINRGLLILGRQCGESEATQTLSLLSSKDLFLSSAGLAASIQSKEEKREIVTGVIAGVAAAGIVIKGLASFLKDINGPNNVKDVSDALSVII